MGMQQHRHWTGRLLARLSADHRGVTAVMLAILLIPLIGFVGIAIDTARAHMLQARMAQALDAAGLAGGRVYFDPRRDGDIQGFFRANLPPGFLGANIPAVTIVENVAAGTLTLSVTASLPSTFMGVLGIRQVSVAARSVVRRADRGMEVALIMDNTGSMYQGGSSTSRLNRMIAAAHELVNILYGDRETLDDLYVALVPYTAAVNVGSHRTGWLAPGSLAALDYQGLTGWKGCVEERGNGEDITDTPPAAAPFQPYFWAPNPDNSNPWPPLNESVTTNTTSNNGRGPNLGCGPAITPLLKSATAVRAAINGMAAWHRGGTASNVGLVWGWRVLSPRWRGLWGGATPAELPLDYDHPLMDKVAIILTDGQNQIYRHGSSPEADYTAYGLLDERRLGTDTINGALTALNSRMAQVCTAMKAQGIILYTIVYEVTSTTTQDLFRNCASGPSYYFNSPQGSDLSAVFRTIGNQLANLRLAE